MQGDDSLMPRELATAIQCKAWGTLPLAGGLYDQPAGLMRRMTAALNVYTAAQAWKKAEWGSFHEKYPALWPIIQQAISLDAKARKHEQNLQRNH